MEQQSPSGGQSQQAPYIPASKTLPEITFKAVVLSIILSAVLAGANAYLGLFAGLTVSASIPAAVISMAVLRMFRQSNILENNIVQTAASAGESLAAGVIFTMPALILLGHWDRFDYLETTMIAGFGGLMGVLFTIPLRRALIVEEPLQFPEGVATAEVLKVGDRAGSDRAQSAGGVKDIAIAGVIGALFKFGETGLRLWSGSLEVASKVGGGIAYFGSNLSPALIAVGYIVGLNIAVLVFVGGALNWLIAIPIVAATGEWPLADSGEPANAVEAAGTIWSTQTRYIGVGAMVIGGLSALVKLRGSLVSGVRASMKAYKQMRAGGGQDIARTERDTPFQWVMFALVGSVIPLFLIFNFVIGSAGVSIVMAVIMLIAGFLFAAVAGYMAGLVGSSNNPISGVTIATILTSSLLLLAMLGSSDPIGPVAAIFIGAVVCCGAAIAGDNMQDLKAGHLLGATPVKQQIMQVIGVLSAAVVMAPALTLLVEAYGIGPATPEKPDSLGAPQATLMASVAKGVFEGGLPWTMISIGAAIALVIIFIDLWLEKAGKKFRMPVLAVAVGIYLPFELSVPIFIGGLIAWLVNRNFDALGGSEAIHRAKGAGLQRGLLFAAGLITGEALIGIGMAVPIAATKDKDVLKFFDVEETPWPGVALLLLVIIAIYRFSMSTKKEIGTS